MKNQSNKTCVLIFLVLLLVSPSSRAQIEGEIVGGLTARPLAEYMTASYYASGDTYYLPEIVKEALSPCINSKYLNAASYKIASSSYWGRIQDTAITFGDRDAIVLYDKIIFKNENAALDLELWAHELIHVEQYLESPGSNLVARVLKFSERYIEDVVSIRTRGRDKWGFETRASQQANACIQNNRAHRAKLLPNPNYLPSLNYRPTNKACVSVPASSRGYWNNTFRATGQNINRIEAKVSMQKGSGAPTSPVRLFLSSKGSSACSTRTIPRSGGSRTADCNVNLRSSETIKVYKVDGNNSSTSKIEVCAFGKSQIKIRHTGSFN